ncbi:MAG: flagellar motor protein MotA [Chromatiales bacterium 21-64-14]|nr:MAG: flagellar motor protein MotA [Chromatiales bacterium 21-64-14]HQU15946.1 MotA/TolQ/ExbB proton channel family protein [Gammaproteobacteria bacterium]
MQDFYQAWNALRFGGPMIYPLLVLAVITVAILLDKTYVYLRYTRPPAVLLRLVENLASGWNDLEHQVTILNPHHHFARFLRVILQNRSQPVWWTESRASDEAQAIERAINRGLWILETIVTAAPLLGLLGTITGMMHAFNLIGSKGLVDPNGVTSGVAEALIATALGLLIALVALFGFNFFSRLQSRTLDEMERIGTRLVDRVRLSAQDPEMRHEAA